MAGIPEGNRVVCAGIFQREKEEKRDLPRAFERGFGQDLPRAFGRGFSQSFGVDPKGLLLGVANSWWRNNL